MPICLVFVLESMEMYLFEENSDVTNNHSVGTRIPHRANFTIEAPD